MEPKGDGRSAGRVSRHVGVASERSDLGPEIEFRRAPSDDMRTMSSDTGKAPGAYGWLFPKRDRLTVGVIQRKGSGSDTRRYLDAWTRSLGGAEREVISSSGQPGTSAFLFLPPTGRCPPATLGFLSGAAVKMGAQEPAANPGAGRCTFGGFDGPAVPANHGCGTGAWRGVAFDAGGLYAGRCCG
jgi:hypothetical protein